MGIHWQMWDGKRILSFKSIKDESGIWLRYQPSLYNYSALVTSNLTVFLLCFTFVLCREELYKGFKKLSDFLDNGATVVHYMKLVLQRALLHIICSIWFPSKLVPSFQDMGTHGNTYFTVDAVWIAGTIIIWCKGPYTH